MLNMYEHPIKYPLDTVELMQAGVSQCATIHFCVGKTGGVPTAPKGLLMKQATAVAPIVALAFLLASMPAHAAGQPGDYSFTATIGESGTKKDNSYRSAEALNFGEQYQKTGFATYRAM